MTTIYYKKSDIGSNKSTAYYYLRAKIKIR